MPIDNDSPTTGHEIELKLDVSPVDLDRLTEAALRTGGPAHITTLTSVYFDTPEQALRLAGLSLRVRHDGDRRIQTVKAERIGSGIFDRSEWQFEIDGDTPDLAHDRSTLAEVIGNKAQKRVVPVFRSVMTRTSTLAMMDDTAIELVVDRGDVIAGETSMPVCEIELELKSGVPNGLFTLARRLDEVAAVHLGVLSKAERGYRLLAPQPGGAFRAEPVILAREMTAVAAFQAIAWSCLRHYRLNEAVLSATGDPGALHQARVALRRLRSALSLFKSVVEDDRYAGLRTELRWLSGVLGEARNLDVLVDRTSDAGLLDRLRPERAVAYRQVDEALAAPRARRLMLDLAEWLMLGVKDEPPAGRAIVAFATRRLDRLRKRLKKDGVGFAELSDADRHEVRIEAKKLRYATEFFKSLYAGKKASGRHKRFRDALESLQNILGDLNDQATGQLVFDRLGLGDLAAESRGTPEDRSAMIGEAVAAYEALLDADRFW